jgi:uncharacterized protein
MLARMVGVRTLPRLYTAILADHLARRRQMAFVTGPRQVGKTTLCRDMADAYLSWDDSDHRRILLRGPAAIASHVGAERLREKPLVVALDELHRYRGWRALLKGLFDTHGSALRFLVTGSSRLDVARRGADSLMGRYLPYRMHPLSVAELAHPTLPDLEGLTRAPEAVPDAEHDALWRHGGFPEPFLHREDRFTRRWSGLRREQLVRVDVRELSRVQELAQIEVLVNLLDERSGTQLVFATLAREVGVSIDTIRRWLGVLVGMHHGFMLRPWWKNVARSLRKEPKWFSRDWSGLADVGQRTETFVACHLLKAVEGWTDLGLGAFHLGYLRDKERREVDFVVVRDRKPWLLVEAKHAEERLSPHLERYQRTLGAPHAIQVVITAPYVDADCFTPGRGPVVAPARTFLSQLL